MDCNLSSCRGGRDGLWVNFHVDDVFECCLGNFWDFNMLTMCLGFLVEEGRCVWVLFSG